MVTRPPRSPRTDTLLPDTTLFRSTESDLVRALQRLAQDDIGLLGQFVGGDDVIGLLIIEDVDLSLVDELAEFERMLALQLDRLDLLFVEQDVLALRQPVTLADVLPVDRADAGTALFIFYRLAAR